MPTKMRVINFYYPSFIFIIIPTKFNPLFKASNHAIFALDQNEKLVRKACVSIYNNSLTRIKLKYENKATINYTKLTKWLWSREHFHGNSKYFHGNSMYFHGNSKHYNKLRNSQTGEESRPKITS